MLVWNHRKKLSMGQINKQVKIPMSISTQHNSIQRAYRENVQILHLCHIHNDTIVGVRLMNKDMKLYLSHTLENVLETQKRENKNKYLLP